MTPYYEHAGITIYHGDCREILCWTNADVLVTDPPYGIGWSRGVNNQRASKAHDGILNDHDTSARDVALRLFDGKPALVFGSFYAPFPEQINQVLVWHKPSDSGVVGSVTGFRRDAEPIFIVGAWPNRIVQWSSVLHTAGSISSVTSETGHPHTKPLSLLQRLILRCPNGAIADPFCGSGSTLVAAKNLGRTAIGVELDERYCEIAAKRLSQEVFDFSEAIG
jgi:DNA modification methylase